MACVVGARRRSRHCLCPQPLGANWQLSPDDGEYPADRARPSVQAVHTDLAQCTGCYDSQSPDSFVPKYVASGGSSRRGVIVTTVKPKPKPENQCKASEQPSPTRRPVDNPRSLKFLVMARANFESGYSAAERDSSKCLASLKPRSYGLVVSGTEIPFSERQTHRDLHSFTDRDPTMMRR